MVLTKVRRFAVVGALAAIAAVALYNGPSTPVATAKPTKEARRTSGRAVAYRPDGGIVKDKNAPVAKSYWIGRPSAEPTIGIDKDGAIFYTAADINRRNSVDVVKSTDKGKTWELVSPRVGPQNVHAVTLDPYIFVDQDTGRVFNIDLTVACSLLSFSDDAGESWTTNPLACGRPVNDHQTLFGGPPATSSTIDYPNVMYYCWNDVASSECSKSIDGGLSFRPTGTPAYNGYDPDEETEGFYDQQGFCGGLHGHGVVGPEGNVYLPREYCGRPMLAISKDEGLTWTRVQVGPSSFFSSNDNSVAVDDKGNLYYVYVGTDRLPRLVTSRDEGETWSRPVAITPPGVNEANLVTIDAGAPGKVAITFMGSTNSPYKKCKPECEAGDYAKTTWNGYMLQTVEAFDRNPLIYAASINHPSDPMKRSTCGPRRCGSTIFDFVDVVIGEDGVAYSPFTDACVLTCATQGGGDTGNEGLIGTLVGGPKLR